VGKCPLSGLGGPKTIIVRELLSHYDIGPVQFPILNSTEAEFGGICPPAELLPMSYFYTYLLNPLNALLPILLGLPQPEQQ
jgi:hypothetical protein